MTGAHVDQQAQVRAYVRAVVPGWPTDKIADVRRLDSGENHDVYVVSLDALELIKVVVRIATSERASDCAIAGREAAVMSEVGSPVAPVVHDFRCASEWFDKPAMCMQFVYGEQRPPATSEEAERLGHTLGSLHGLRAVSLNEWPGADLSLAEYLDASVAKIDERLPFIADPLPAAAQSRLRGARDLLDEAVQTARTDDSFRDDSSLVVLHGDVAGGNIVWTPAPVLIDWEYARFGDAADEVAYIFNQNDLTGPQRQAFWQGYREGRGSEASGLLKRVSWWEPVTVLGSAFFWVELWWRRAVADATRSADLQVPKDQAYYRDHTVRRLERAESLLQQLDRPG